MSFFISHTGSRLLRRSHCHVVARNKIICFRLFTMPSPVSPAHEIIQIVEA